MALPHCDELFVRYFRPWYTEEDRTRRVYQATRPDIEELSAPADLVASDISPLTAESQADAAERVGDMLEAATDDWKTLLGVRGSPSIDWIVQVDRYFHSRRVQRIIARSDPEQYDNDYLVLCSELGAVLGAVLRASEPRLSWLYDWPYWESGLYDQPTRSRINVFHWAVKKLSSYAVDDGLADKVNACLRMLHEPK